MIQLLFLVLFAKGAVALLLMVEVGPLRELAMRGVDQVKTGKGPTTVKMLTCTLSLILMSSVASILKIQNWDLKLGTVSPMDQVLWRTHLLEAFLIDARPWAVTIADPNGDERCLLHKVPMQICSTNPTEHEPSYISIGPYHYTNGGLQVRSNLWKDRCVKELESLSPSTNFFGDEMMTWMLLTDAQKYYDKNSFCNLTDEDFNKIMVTDGCFILTTMNGLKELTEATGMEGQELGASLQSSTTPNLWDKQFWWHDLFLYGNQIPFVVVQAIYEHIHPELPNTEIALPLRKIEEFVRSGLARFTIREVKNPEKADHILHLCHELLKPTDADKQLVDGRNASDVKDKVWRWRRATEYSELLLKFKRRDLGRSAGDAHCISDVRVRGRVVEIPWLELDSETWRLLRNLMLLEQMNPHLGSHVTAYCIFISQVASTGADVNLLARDGIIVHREASDEKAAKKLSKLCEHIIAGPGNNYLKPVWHALDKHCESGYWSLRAKLSGYKDWKNPLEVLGAVVPSSHMLQAFYRSFYRLFYSLLAYRYQIKSHPPN